MKLCMGCMENIEDHVTTCPYCGYDETTLRQESYYLDPGTVVGGKYIVGRVMGYAGYTVTYLGMDAEQNRKVMIKEYLPSDFSTRSEGEKEVTIYSGDALEQFEQGLTTFLNEANRIQHLENVPGIAKVYDCVAENDTGYVISEYLEGQTLKEVLDSGRVFAPQEAKDFIAQILEGLRLVHPLNVIHCDIAPETIMITNTGEIKLLDFGATRYVTTANSKSLAIILKQGYAPEEQYRSRGERGPWTDVYALAAVMYRMITGNVPDESVDRALMDELKEPSKLGISIPKNIENAMMNALNVYQKDRTPSAEVFLKELNSPEVMRIHVKKKKYETGKFPRWAKGLVAGLLCLVLVGGGVVVYQLKDKTEQVATTNVPIPDIIKNGDVKEEDAIEMLEKEGLQYKRVGAYFNQDREKEGSIYKISNEGKQEDLQVGKTVPRGTEIRCIVWTNKECSYRELLEYKSSVWKIASYFGLQKKLNKKKPEEICVEAKGSDKEKESYNTLYAINLDGGERLSKEQLEKNQDKKIRLDKITSIEYYTGCYYHENPLERDYRWMNTAEVKFKEYKKDKRNKERGTGRKGCPDPNQIYISISAYSKGTIVRQTLAEGKEYSSLSYDKKDKLFWTVRDQLNWTGKTGEDLEKELENMGLKTTIKFMFEGNKKDPVYSVWGDGTNVVNVKSGTLFPDDGDIMVALTIKTQPRLTLNPRVTDSPKPKKRSPKRTPKETPEGLPGH